MIELNLLKYDMGYRLKNLALKNEDLYTPPCYGCGGGAATFLGFLREVIPIIFYGAAESEVSLVDFLERF